MSEEVSIKQLAHRYIQLRNLKDSEGNKRLIYYKNKFWRYSSNIWAPVAWDVMISDMIKLLDEDSAFLNDSKIGVLNSVLRTIQAFVSVDSIEQNTYVGEGRIPDRYYVPMKNGILVISVTPDGLAYDLRPLTHLFFNTYILPYDYEPASDNNVFTSYLNEILGPDEIKFLRQWFGYCLIPETIAEKFLLMHGGGANGKSVVLSVLCLLLGEDNVSHVHLQGFYSQADFDASDTVGKLCNTAQEIDKVKDVPSGFLKEYVSGDRMRANEKFKAAYDFTPTARLIFACNHLPEFRDDSDGFMRRLIILKFQKQFLKSNANKTYKKKSFWLTPGVLSAVFNWAIVGLEELIKNEWEFHEPQSVIDAQEEYIEIANPMIEFLRDNVELAKDGEIIRGRLYDEYSDFCRRYGFAREDKNYLGKTVRKVFPLAQHSGNQRMRPGGRTYLWFNIRLIKDAPKVPYLVKEEPVSAQVTYDTQTGEVLDGILNDPQVTYDTRVVEFSDEPLTIKPVIQSWEEFLSEIPDC